MRRYWVNFQFRGVLLIWIIVGQGPIALAVGAGGGCLDIFSLIYIFSFLSPSLGDGPIYTEILSQRALNNQPPEFQNNSETLLRVSQNGLIILLLAVPRRLFCFWFFGEFRCGALLFVVIHVIYKYKNR